MWQACHAAHAPGSEAAKACDELSGYVDQLWRQVGPRSCCESQHWVPRGLQLSVRSGGWQKNTLGKKCTRHRER